VTVVHQLLSGAGPHDAVTTEAGVFRTYFRSWGWGGGDYAFRIAPGLNGAVADAQRLRAAPEDLLLLHHSAGWPGLDELLALPNRKLLIYHGVTPPDWLWEHSPVVAAHCAAGREQLRELLAVVDLAAAHSTFSVGELIELGAARTEVIPLIARFDELGPVGPDDADPPGPPTVLFVGRLSPHKRHDEVIRAFALLRRYRQTDARLALVGDPVGGSYLRLLQRLADSLAPGAITIESGLSPTALGDRYRAAHAFLCLSEHEGFCIPVLEAFHFGVPVVARPAGAVAEVAGDAAVLVDDRDPAVISELLALVLTDHELRAELRRRGRQRLDVFSPDAIAARLRRAVEQI
jgi:L-malate glycosyltransferase